MAVSDGVVEVFHDMKVCALSEEVKKQKEMELFHLSEAKKETLAGDVDQVWTTQPRLCQTGTAAVHSVMQSDGPRRGRRLV